MKFTYLLEKCFKELSILYQKDTIKELIISKENERHFRKANKFIYV